MFSPATIRDMQAKAAREAARKGRKPYVLFNAEEVDRFPPFPFPFIGTHMPKGWETVTGEDGDELTLFVDTSGFGSDTEPALSPRQLKEELKQLLAQAAAKGDTYGFALVSVGQFQAYLGVYRKVRS